MHCSCIGEGVEALGYLLPLGVVSHTKWGLLWQEWLKLENHIFYIPFCFHDLELQTFLKYLNWCQTLLFSPSPTPGRGYYVIMVNEVLGFTSSQPPFASPYLFSIYVKQIIYMKNGYENLSEPESEPESESVIGIQSHNTFWTSISRKACMLRNSPCKQINWVPGLQPFPA